MIGLNILEKLLDSDWLRAVQLKSQGKSVIPVEKHTIFDRVSTHARVSTHPLFRLQVLHIVFLKKYLR